MHSDNQNILASIIVPAFNAQKYIEETINSVLSQTYTNWELVIVNDGSTDNTLSIIEDFAQKDKRIISLNISNSGVSAARNEGIKRAKGDVVFFLDADDVWKSNNVEKKIKYLTEHNLCTVYSSCELINEESASMNYFLNGSGNLKLEDILSSKGNYTTAPSGVVLTKEAIKLIEGFDVNLSNNADQDLFIRLLAAGCQIGFIPDVTWKYRVHTANMSKNVKLLEKDILYVFNKAAKNKLFKSFWFKQKCFSKVYIMLAGSWWKNGNNKWRAFMFLIRAILIYPLNIFSVLSKN